MSLPAATVTSQHTCPMVTGNLPHIGGPILSPGVTTVLIGGMPAAVAGSNAICVGPVDQVIRGSNSVLIGGRSAARVSDPTAHGGVITTGVINVLIG